MSTSETARESSGTLRSFSARRPSAARSVSGRSSGLTDGEPCGGTSCGISLRLLWSLVLDFFLKRLPDGFKTDKPLFVCRFLARRQKARVTVRNLSGGWLLLAAHKSPLHG